MAESDSQPDPLQPPLGGTPPTVVFAQNGGSTVHVPANKPATSAPAGITPIHGETIGPYRITGFLGRGGTALVYAAADEDDAPVALKVMDESPLLPAGLLERFMREADAAKQLRQHPNIVTVYDTGVSGTTHYIAMELVTGGSLEDLIDRGKVAPNDAVDLGIQVAEALTYAHYKGVVHRDLKPSNILLSEFGKPLLADFGLARFETGQSFTLTNTALGTPGYMSPEQTCSAKVDHRTDIYSFGVVLYELLTGQSPYTFPPQAAMGQIFDTIRHQTPARPRKHNRRISRNLEAILLNLLEKDPALRYGQMTRVVADLRACRAGGRVSVRVPNLFERFDRLMRRHKITAATTAATMLTFAGLWLRFNQQLREERVGTLMPVLNAERKTRELEELRGLASGTTAPVDQVELLLGEARGSLLAGDADTAMARYMKLLKLGTDDNDSGISQLAQREIARCLLAQRRPVAAAESFALLAEEMGETPGGNMALFEQGLALELAGQQDAAHEIWNHLQTRQRPGKAIIFLCRVALGQAAPQTAAQTAWDMPRITGALGLFLASRRAPTDALRQDWQQQTRARAETTLPWLFHFLDTAANLEQAPNKGAPHETSP